MRYLAPVLAALALAVPVVAQAAGPFPARPVQVAQAWPAPAQRYVEWSHRYEVYNTTNGEYTQVDPRSVPDRVARGEWIYDRTAGIWYNHPGVADYSYGPGYAYGRGGVRLVLPPRHRYEVYEPQGPSYQAVDVGSVPARIQRGEWIYDRTAQTWVSHPSVGLNPRYTADARGWGDRDRDHGYWDRQAR